VKNALVTGSAGFIGRHMVRELLRREYVVSTVDIMSHFRHDCMDVFTKEHVEVEKYDLVCHFAAAGPNRVAIDTKKGNFAYNIMLDSAMFDWAVRARPHHVVYMSSCAAYPFAVQSMDSSKTKLVETMWTGACDFVDDYGMGKSIGEFMAHRAVAQGVPVTIVRPFSGYGEDQSTDFPFGAFIDRALRREDPFTVWGSADQMRDWIHVDDIIAGILMLVDHGVIGDPVNLCTGRGTSLGNLAWIITQMSGYTPEIRVDTDAPLGAAYRVGDPTKMHKFFKPTVALEDGIQRALRYRRIMNPTLWS
jgi:nucleoside-diphosphate-sugar epimerase